MPQEIVIDCPHCEVRIQAEATSWVTHEDSDAGFFLVRCPSCRRPLFGTATTYQNQYNNWAWDTAERLWPTPSVGDLGLAIPDAARRDIKDAQKCLSHGIYSAAAVLCGRALERLIKEKAGANMIGKGLAELKAKGIIDERLFAWAEALRKERNIGAARVGRRYDEGKRSRHHRFHHRDLPLRLYLVRKIREVPRPQIVRLRGRQLN